MERYTNLVQDNAGNALGGVTVTVYDTGTSNLSTLYTSNGSGAKSNPFTNDTDGTFEFYASSGRYDIVYVKSGYTFTAANYTDVKLYDQADAGLTYTSPVLAAPTFSGSYSLSTGLVTATGSVTARSLATRFAEIANVKDYGAVGDGVTDDTTAFQAAAAIGGAIFVPAGTYILDYVTLSLPCHWFGEGATSILKKKANSVGVSYSADYYSYLFNILSVEYTYEFSNLAFDGNFPGQVTTRTGATPANAGSGAASANNYNGSATVMATGGMITTAHAPDAVSTSRFLLRIRDCYFARWVTIAIYHFGTLSVESLSEVDISGCVFENGGPTIGEYHDGVSLYDGILFPASGYSFSTSGVTATAIYIVDNAKARITNSKFYERRDQTAGTVTTGFDFNVTNIPMSAVVVTVNSSTGTTQDDPLDWSELVVANNTFEGMGRCNWTGNGIGIIDFYTRLGNASISNNVFTHCFGDPIRGKTNAKNLSIIGNVIENVVPVQYAGPLGINIGPNNYPAQRGNYVISNNVVNGLCCGIQVSGHSSPPENSDPNVADDADSAANNIIISNNVIMNIKPPAFTNAVFQAAYSTYGWGIQVQYCSGVTVANNIIDTTTTVTGSLNTEHGIYIRNTKASLLVIGNAVVDIAQIGVEISSHTGRAVVEHNTVDTCGDYGIEVTNTGENIIIGNSVTDTVLIGILAGASAVTSIVCDLNFVTDVGADSASSAAGISTGSATGATTVSLAGNVINNISNLTGSAYGMVVTLNATPSDNNTASIIGNTIDNTEESGIILTDVSGIIASNIFKNVNTAASTAHAALLINGVTNVGKLTIRDNTVEGTTMYPSSGGGSYDTVHEVTIATGAITVNVNDGVVLVDTEADAATDDLDTIAGTQDGQIITLRAINGGRDVVVKDGTLELSGDMTLNNVEDTITLRNSNGTLYEMCRSDNGA